MTRFLSQALNNKEPKFRRDLQDLEVANGHPKADIHLSLEVMNGARSKCRELGLDPTDTTAEELYHALQVRIKSDDQKLTRRLRTIAATRVSAEADPISGMVEALKDLPDSKACFALKTAKLRTLLKVLSPKKTMKVLGYRSIDSLLKHENPIDVLAAAWLSESLSWQKRLMHEYRGLTPSDFEERSIKVLYASERRYKTLGEKIVNTTHHNILSLKELGAIVLLPLPEDAPSGVVTASLSLAIHELNEIRAASTYLKLSQFSSGFGSKVAKVSLSHPELEARVFDQPVPWSLIQRYYARLGEEIQSAVFEPYVSLEDMIYRPIEEALTKIEPELAFWHGTDSLGLIESNQPVSLNLIDNAISLCNNLPFEKRIASYFQNSLWHELLMRYLKHDSLEHNVFGDLMPSYAYQEATL
jgi:hypothetical protein